MNAMFPFKTSAVVEILTGLALLVTPTFVVGLLLSDGANPTGLAVARILGIGLLSVGIAGWESQGKEIHFAPRAGLCTYNVGAATTLLILGTYGGMNGILLWPAMILHAVIGAMMLWVILVPSPEAADQ